MAQRVSVTFLDDMDGQPAAETVSFAIDGATFEIDLSAKNARALRKAYEPWVGVARQVGGRSTRPVEPRMVATPVDNQAVRAWASSNRVSLPPRGRIPNSVIEQFRAAGN